MFAAAILAAGRSARMGRPKALLPHRSPGSTFVGHLVAQAKLAGLVRVLVVGRDRGSPLERAAEASGAVFVVNPAPDRGQLSSLLAAIAAIDGDPECEGLLVMPVDVPLISAGVIESVLRSARADRASIVRAVYRGAHGHPVLFKRPVFEELRSADPAVGAREVVRRNPRRVLDVEVEDPAVLADIDTPADYARLFGIPLD